MAGQTNRWTIIPIRVNTLKFRHLDTSACKNAYRFFQAFCLQYPNSIPGMVGRRDKCMKWQQYPLASMSAEGKSFECINMPILCHSFPVICQQMHRNLECRGRMDGRTIIPAAINKLRMSRLGTSACQNRLFFQRCFRNTKTQVHGQLGGLKNA